MPPKVQMSNATYYKAEGTITDVKVFPDRSHLLDVQGGRQEIADYALDWAPTPEAGRHAVRDGICASRTAEEIPFMGHLARVGRWYFPLASAPPQKTLAGQSAQLHGLSASWLTGRPPVEPLSSCLATWSFFSG